MHPGAWVLWALSATLVAISATNPFYLLPLIAVCALVNALAGGRSGSPASFKVFLMFGLVAMGVRTALVVFGTVSAESIAAAALEGLRLATMLAIYGAFNSVTNPQSFLKLAPRRFHEPALAAALALSIAPRTIQAARVVREAQRLRGISISRWRSLPALAVPVLETGLEDAFVLAESMDARGHGRSGRSRYRPQRWEANATLTVLASATALAAFLFFAYAGEGELLLSTFPLHWPEVSIWLVVGVLALALPGFLVSAHPEAHR
jgi:energy-coupling factor transport system permease protein